MSFVNSFGWSISRESMFDSCRRRYYFHYYFSWGGWESSAPHVVREAFKLKRLVSLALWRGQLVHYVASKVLQSMKAKGRIPSKKDVLDYTLERFKSQHDFSSAGMYLTEPKKRRNRLNIDWLALFEHEYGMDLPAERLERTRRECVEAIEGLFECPLLQAIERTDPSGWIIEDLDHAEFSQKFEFKGVTVFAKTDLMFREKDSTLGIVDWKTYRETGASDGGKDEDRSARVQLGIYGYYAANVLHVPIHSIRLYEVNLLNGGKVREHEIEEDDLRFFEDYIEEGISRLSAVLAGRDTGRNEPLPPEHFPRIDNGKCKYCNFFRICKDESYPDRLP